MAIDPTNQSSYEFGEFRLDSADRVLMRGEELVPLTAKVFDLLLVLVQNHGHVVEKDLLIKEIWPDTFVEEGNLTQNISVLRKILSDDGHQYIQTVPRRGYRFVGRVREIPDETVLIEERSRARIVVEESETENAVRVDSPTINQRRSQAFSWRTLALISLVTLAVAAAGIGWRVLRPREIATRQLLPFEVNNVTLRTITSTGNIVYGIISADGQFVVYCRSDEDNRFSLWLQRTGSRDAVQLIEPTIDPVSPGAISHDNNWIYYGRVKATETSKGSTLYRMPLLGGQSRKVVEGVHVFAALSPDDQRILLHRFKESGGVDVISVNALDGSDEQLIASSNIASDFLGTKWSPDGSKLLFFSREQRADGNYWSVSEMPAQGGGPPKTILAPSQRKIWFLAWADNGRGIVMTATDPVTKIPQLFYVSYPDGETRRITNDLVAYTTISVGGETIMAGRVERQSKVWITNWPMPGLGRQIIDRDISEGLAWTPDGHIVYDASDDGRLHLWIADSEGRQRQQLSPDNADEGQPDVSPDGKLVCFLSKRSGSVALWVTDTEGRNPRQLTAGGLGPWRPRFTADGQSILFLMDRDGHTLLARIPVAGGEPITIADDVYGESFFDISPDGTQLAYSVKDSNSHATRVVVRPMNGGAQAKYFDIEPSYFLRWTPDGKSLAYAQLPEDRKKGEALWLQPLNQGRPQQILNVTPDLIYWAAWSRDGKQLAFSHGGFSTDIVLVSRNKTHS